MPASLSEITAEIATTAITLGDDPEACMVTYRKHGYNADVEELLSQARRDETPAKGINRVFIQLVKSWTFKFAPDDESPIPLTEEGLKPVPSDFLGDIMRQIGEHRASQLPNVTTANGSRPH